MINLRNIFNPNYNIIGIILIIFITILILLININNIKESLNSISKTFITSGIISLIIDLIIYVLTNLIPTQYKIFITIISNNIIKNIAYISIITLTIGFILLVLSKINNEERSE